MRRYVGIALFVVCGTALAQMSGSPSTPDSSPGQNPGMGAQNPMGSQNPMGGQNPTDGQDPSAIQNSMSGVQGASQSGTPSMKQIFASSLAAVVGGMTGGLGAMIVGGLVGGIKSWFSKPNPAPVPGTAAQAGAGATSGTMAGSGMGQTTAMGSPGGATPGGAPAGMGGAMGGMTAPGMGAMPTAMTAPGMGQGNGMDSAASTSAIYAGVAFEVHSLDRNGTETLVDAAMHPFATGERFVVLYRPTLPGTVTVTNINPLGQEKQIDSLNVAGGELARLGPYEFRDTTGTEKLRLTLTPCRTNQLLAQTRDIVRADASPGGGDSSSGPAPALNLTDCGTVKRGLGQVQTRDIGKVTTEGGTQYALDPVSNKELSTGQIAPRDLLLTFTHQ